MFKSIAVRYSQGSQTIKDPRQASPKGFRGRPQIADADCAPGCSACLQSCSVRAIEIDPLRIDLGRCIQCADCVPACPAGVLDISGQYKLAAADRADLVISRSRPELEPVRVSQSLRKRFGRSLKMRSVSAGGCNGCELEINALTNVNFDIGRYGIDIVASPRHADALVLSGPITRNMAQALSLCWQGMPDPKFVIAVGACAISGSPFEGADALEREFLDRFSPALYVPGCPPHPLTFVCGILDLLGIDS
ncbi:MAG: 4Fe-4S binding protein [Burkholderiaceae bacterium]|nr:4Fe-4S binding protein [Burkholderiaceae bacterium]